MKLRSTLLPCLACCLFPAVAQAALTSVYRFDESGGTTTADTIRGAPGSGTLNGGTTFVAGKIGNAVDLNGSTDYITALNTVPTGTTAFSVAAWVWADSAPVWGSIVKNWGGATPGAFHLGFDVGSGRISNYVSVPTVGPALAPALLSLGAWHHIALTYDGGAATQTLYIDGSAVSSAAASGSLTALGTLMGIGVKLGDTQTGPDAGAPGFWDGKIDDLAFWNNTLTPAQVAAIKTNGDLGIGVGVPEPASVSFLALAALGLVRRRR